MGKGSLLDLRAKYKLLRQKIMCKQFVPDQRGIRRSSGYELFLNVFCSALFIDN